LALLRDNKTKQKYDIIKNKIESYVESVDIQFAGELGFNVGLYGPMSITYINKAKLDKNIKFKYVGQPVKIIHNLNDANLIGDYNLIKSIENILKAKSQIMLIDVVNKNPKKYFVNLSSIVGGGKMSVKFYDDIIRTFGNKFNLINNTTNKVTTQRMRAEARGKKEGNWKSSVSFNSEKEAQNFLKFITKTKIIKYLAITYNIDQHIVNVWPYTPIMDFNYEWTDEKINKFFNFSKEQIKFINNIVDRDKSYGYGFSD
jgi:site-specific DNA-methyltransferase (adenine-specific)